ncbi:hypothetical protein HMPREF9123_2343 [Neisseria bacilliformis ATCC BAA-1200]|uniref:Uncharacterized protein n=1 Tax=Neisseria bacilliformis ATCC BAA-1200 TaxID=888742 RepID=F2BF36_9NEIS|nr:hypothetical protein HMPREF9123_2343 [Neisseria bacilliformis ATCC BAA-1200]
MPHNASQIFPQTSNRARGCAIHPTQKPSESVFGRSGIYARRFL